MALAFNGFGEKVSGGFFLGKFLLWGWMLAFPQVRDTRRLSRNVGFSSQGVSAALVNNAAEFCKDTTGNLTSKSSAYLTSPEAPLLL